MEFQNMKRRELQALCKLNNIPANLTNAAMSNALSLLPIVEGLGEFLRDPTASEPGSPESSVVSTPAPTRTATRVKTTTTRYGTRSRAVESTVTGKTPATQTARKKPTETDRQAAFEADMEQSDVSDSSALLGQIQEISEAVSGLNMNCVEKPSLEIQKESENHDVQEVINVDDIIEIGDVVNDGEQEISEVFNNHQKVDFHTLPRRDLQSLCKKNKIPANTSNATMADALESLRNVEGLAEFLQEYNSQAPPSPTMSEMTSSCARRTWTSRKITKEPASSKMLTKSCRGSRKTVIENLAQEKSTMSETLDAVPNSDESKLFGIEAVEMEKAEVVEFASETTMSETHDGLTNSGESILSVIEEVQMEKHEVVFAAEMTTSETQDVVSDPDEGNLSVIEAVETEKHEVLSFASETAMSETKSEDILNVIVSDISTGNFGFHNEENVKQLDESENEEDEYSEGTEALEHLQNVPSAVEAKNTEVFSDDMESESECESEDEGTTTEGTEALDHLQNVSSAFEAKNTEVFSDDMESERESEDEGTTTEGSDTEGFSDAGSDLCLVEKLEGAQEDDPVSEKFDSEVASLTDQPPVYENNAETAISMDLTSSTIAAQLDHNAEAGLDISPSLELDSIRTDLAAQKCEEETLEKLESRVNPTPLVKKSMRKLRKLLREKLQEANSLANRLENLTLEEKDVKLAKVEEDMDEEQDDTEVVSDASDLYPVDKLMDNMISEDDVSGIINVEKIVNITPSRTPMPVSDINKENIGTASAKIAVARSGNLLADMSMIKLKKALQQQSEKRTALHKLSDNCHPLASPIQKIPVALAGEIAESNAK